MNPTAPADLTAVAWRKSTRSSGGGSNCVEIARLSRHFAIRDSKNPQGSVLIITPAAFRKLIVGIAQGTVRG